MLKVKNLKKTFTIVMVAMLLILMASSVYATSGAVVINGSQTGTGSGVQAIPTLNTTNTNSSSSASGSTGVTAIPTTTNNTTNTTTTANNKSTVTVTVTANKEVQALQGWTLSANKKVLTKQYTANTTESITLTDTAGNKSDPIQIKVDLSLTNGGTNVDYTLGNSDTTKPSASVKYTKTTGTANGNLPKTGVDYTALIIMAVCAISGVYAYLKIRDYNTIQY